MVSVTPRCEQAAPKVDPGFTGSGGRGREPRKKALKKVFICSPFRPVGESAEQRDRDMKKNIALALQACRYAVDQGYVPYAPHLYFPQFLTEGDPDEREMGILMGLTWLVRCDEVWVCGTRISEGMSREIAQAKEWNKPLRAYLPLCGAGIRVFDADFLTEDEFFKTLVF